MPRMKGEIIFWWMMSILVPARLLLRLLQIPKEGGHAEAVLLFTSGSTGEPKGVVLNVGNLNHMLGCINARLDLLIGPQEKPDQVFHYLPFSFAGSWTLLLTSLVRKSVLTMSTDISKLVDEMRVAAPDYFLNVPALLERVREAIG